MKHKYEVSVLISSLYINKELFEAIKSIVNCDFPKNKYEIIVVHENNKNNLKGDIKDYGVKKRVSIQLIKIPSGKGLGYNRHMAVRFSKGKYLACTDADCKFPKEWLKIMYNEIKTSKKNVAAVQGSVKVPKSNYLGNCIALLGFPGGASVGFDKIFYVDKNNYTNQISTGNCIFKKALVLEVGNFTLNKKYSYVEDKEMALRLNKEGYKVKFTKNSYVMHPPTKKIFAYFRRQYIKGFASQIMVEEYKLFKEMGKTRIISIKNIIMNAGISLELPLVVFLLFTGYFFWACGYLIAKIRSWKDTTHKSSSNPHAN